MNIEFVFSLNTHVFIKSSYLKETPLLAGKLYHESAGFSPKKRLPHLHVTFEKIQIFLLSCVLSMSNSIERRGGGSEQWWQIIMLTLSDMGRGSNWPSLLLNSHECQTANVKWLNLISLLANSSKRVCRCVCMHTCKFLFVFFKYWEYYHITEFRGWVIFEILEHYQHYLHYLHSEGA